MKKIRLLPLILAISLLLCITAPVASALDDPQLGAKAVVLADMASGRIIYSENMYEQRSPASLTKIMTALIAIEKVEAGEAALSDIVTAQPDCRTGLDSDSSNADIMEGEQMSLSDLLYCAMVHSANEACNVIASYLGGSISGFVDLMNEEAARLGCTNTHFSDPNGLSNENHYSTAYDLYLITNEAIKHELFMQYCNTVSVEIPATNVNKARTYYSSNALLSADSMYGSGYLYEGAAGVKTGYTRAAGYCLISTATREDVGLLAIVLGCDGVLNSDSSEYGNFVDTIALYDWAFENFSYQEALNTNYDAATIDVELAANEGDIILHPQGPLQLLLPNDIDLGTLMLDVRTYGDTFTAPIASGTVLGEADVYIEGVNYGTIKLILTRAVDLSKSEYMKLKLNETLEKTWVRVTIVVLAVLALAYIALVLRYRSLRRKHLKAKKRAEMKRRAEQQRRAGTGADQPTQRFRQTETPDRGEN